MKVKNCFVWFTILLGLSFPSTTSAQTQEKATSVGIGFRTEQPKPTPTRTDPKPSDPAPINNVLPTTLGQTRYYTQSDQPQTASKGTLPKTGEQRQAVFLRLIGLGCITSCFWLFLFTRLREEEQENEENDTTAL
ncbi:LPXTG cell wall anchor domain-containing protein [Enterococcus sp. AZ163]|uniref:LPXTG cell wall anchor domain-containing protein n=1 Tax=Enterococcus sp. AZ163 TaxID=2774638 RepID=UPI003D2AE6AF